MKQIYFDNATTSFPKPENVINSITYYATNIGTSPNRGTSKQTLTSNLIIYKTRQKLAEFFNFNSPQNVIFTKNITESMNILLFGLLKKDDHVITTSLETNSIYRPLSYLKSQGVSVSYAKCKPNGEISVEDIARLIKPKTKAVVISHACTVNGTILPIKEIGALCKKKSIIFIVNADQTAGYIPIDTKKCNINALVFSGHKKLLSFQGIAGFLVDDQTAKQIDPLLYGYTGDTSHSKNMPSTLPYKFEAGTQNILGIFGIYCGLDYIKHIGLHNIYKKELDITNYFKNSLNPSDNYKIIPQGNKFCPIVSLDFKVCSNEQAAKYLSRHEIVTSLGLHDAPLAHKTLSTFENGTVRFSFSHQNTYEDVDFCIDKIKKIIDFYKM